MEELRMFLKGKPLVFKIVLVLFLAGLFVGVRALHVLSTEQQDDTEFFDKIAISKPAHVRGVHVTAWAAGSPVFRKKHIWGLLDETEINTLVIGIKEVDGVVAVPGVAQAKQFKAYHEAIPDLPEFLTELRRRGVYSIARIVVFKDKIVSEAHPAWAVKNPDGTIWRDNAEKSWLDPYNKEVWEYTFSISKRCLELGFQEIQFDYIRYPSDGNTRLCRYSYANHNSSSAATNLEAFLEAANKRFKPMGANLSIDIFGLIPSVDHDMGIGQSFLRMTQWVDYVSPMVYPSHYAMGEYGIPNPNREPYKVVYRTMSDAKRKLGENFTKIRPYLQDFDYAGVKYGPEEVRAQIQASEDVGVKEWLLWNAGSKYTKGGLKSRAQSGVQ
ncbi:MAG: hypothetical protein A2901_03630 [Elusimicrobia bacterium RIFCSPLOWO2_01_FULL_54_10]|nr:MAG: hypothetical protein A2901_03630 [Elusimicrobia bacterium RIFCSPLOWO2_01_FULL_54_10]